MIGDILDIAAAVGNMAGNVSNNAGKVGTAVNAAVGVGRTYADSKLAVMSIAEKAKKSIMMYKVWMSASVRETELAQNINKWLEGMYSIFTMLVLGFNPIARDNNELKNVVSGISAESFKPDWNTKSQEAALAQAMTVLDSERKTSTPRIGKNYKSVEADDLSASVAKGINDGLDDRNEKALRDARLSQRVSETRFVDYMKTLNTNSYPTIVNMEINVGGGKDNKINIPLAIKCNVYPMGSDETRLLVESGISGKMFDYLRKIKWRSGEISTLAWIFNTDIAAKSRELYAKLGRNPMFQELQQRKAASKRSFWGKFLTRFGSEYADNANDREAYKTVNASIANVPPTSSLILSSDDIVAATRLNIEHFTKNDGFVNRFMKDNFLLCLGIVDHALSQCTFFIMGYKQPFKLSFDELKNQANQDSNKTLADTVKMLAAKV